MNRRYVCLGINVEAACQSPCKGGFSLTGEKKRSILVGWSVIKLLAVVKPLALDSDLET